MDASALEQDSFNFAKSAIDLDSKRMIPEAIFYYKEAAESLRQAAIAGSKLDCVTKANEYMERVDVLQKFLEGNQAKNEESKVKNDAITMGMQRAKFLVLQAFDEDSSGNDQEALELYAQAAELCIETRSKPGITTDLIKNLNKLAKQALDRAEDIKSTKITKQLNALPDVLNNSISTPANKSVNSSPAKPNLNVNKKPLGIDFRLNDNDIPPKPSSSPNVNRKNVIRPPSSNKDGYTKEEIAVLRATSLVNNIEYVPFMSVDLKERFAFPVPYRRINSDKHGLLELSAKQKQRLASWKRPSDIMDDPKMIMAISSFSIKQTVVSDCSFVASLAISAAYERKYKKKLITSIIYPQNKKGEPIYNPCGKFMVKLHINGVPRKVIIDDRLPIDKYGELLCSYSVNKNELWVSLVEKAYLKVMGGYDFPGSNSNIDLHALTGWIPERRSLRDENFNKDKCFDEVHKSFHKGHCLATISTGQMSEAEADRAGLVPTHAYAVLDIQKVEGLQMLQLKNPWSHVSWKGRYSANNDERWTPKLRKALNYDNKLAQQFDNGVFWIDFESALHFFDTLYISWNPELFPRTTCLHAAWKAQDGPQKDAYSVSNNPQYILSVNNSTKSTVWILLTRHITEKDDFAVNKEYITLLVYKNNGKKVYYARDPPPYIDGVRINSPHYLTRIQLPAATGGPNKFTLVVSQYQKSKNISYTLRVYCVNDFLFDKVPDPYKYRQKFNCEWTKANAGGCENHRSTYPNNPCFQINLMQASSEPQQLLIEMRGPKLYSVGFDIVCVDTKSGEKTFTKESSGNFRSGYSMKEFTVNPGVYNITLCTFMPGQIGPFFFDIACSYDKTKVVRLK